LASIRTSCFIVYRLERSESLLAWLQLGSHFKERSDAESKGFSEDYQA